MNRKKIIKLEDNDGQIFKVKNNIEILYGEN